MYKYVRTGPKVRAVGKNWNPFYFLIIGSNLTLGTGHTGPTGPYGPDRRIDLHVLFIADMHV